MRNRKTVFLVLINDDYLGEEDQDIHSVVF